MTIYIIAFVLSTALVEAAGRTRSNAVRIMIAAPALLIVSYVAGVRDLHVGGPDAAAYGQPLFLQAAQARNVDELLYGAAPIYSAGEQGYIGLNFLVSRLTSDAHVYLAILAALVCGIVLAAIMLMRSYGSTGLMWLTFLCTSYVDSFNLLRQSPALALALLGVVLTLRSRPLLGLLAGLSGLLFHTSAVIFLPMWVVAAYLMRDRPRPGRRAVLVAAAAGIASFLGAPLINLAANFAGGRFAAYLTADAAGGAAFGIDTLYRLIPLVAAIIAYRALVRRRLDERPEAGGSYIHSDRQRGITLVASLPEEGRTAVRSAPLLALIVLLTIELMMIPLREISYPLYRVPLYFGYVKILAYSMIVQTVRANRGLAGATLVLFVVAYFLLVVVERNAGAYSSAILGV